MEDSEAVSKFVETGDPEFFALLVRRYQERVFRLAVSILGPGLEHEAEEVTQEVFLRAFRRIRSFRMESRFYTWLYRLAYNLTIDRKHRALSRPRHLGEDALAQEADPRQDTNPLAAAFASRRREVLNECLSQLPDLYRSVLYQAYWMGCSIDEIAETLGAPANTIKSYLHRARLKLHALLREKGLVNSRDLHGV